MDGDGEDQCVIVPAGGVGRIGVAGEAEHLLPIHFIIDLVEDDDGGDAVFVARFDVDIAAPGAGGREDGEGDVGDLGGEERVEGGGIFRGVDPADGVGGVTGLIDDDGAAGLVGDLAQGRLDVQIDEADLQVHAAGLGVLNDGLDLFAGGADAGFDRAVIEEEMGAVVAGGAPGLLEDSSV